MEEFQIAREKAKEKMKIADHILNSTFPLVKDPRLLIGVMDNIFLALTNAMNSVLYYERLFKRIPDFNEDFNNKFSMFKERVARKYNLSSEYSLLIQNIKEIIIEHKKSPVEFSRGDRFVICANGYRCKSISVNDMKKFINKGKSFINEVNSIVSKNERIFR